MDLTPTPSKHKQSPTSNDLYKQDYSTTLYTQQYLPTLKTAGYLIGQPLLNSELITTANNGKPLTPITGNYDGLGNVTSGGEILQYKNIGNKQINNIGNNGGSRSNSRLIYAQLGNNVIIHEHPSRLTRSPSPISHNPQSNIVPQTNFIYNSSTPPRSPTPPGSSRLLVPSTQKQSYSIPYPLNPSPPRTAMISRLQYDKCVQQCKIWQQKYNQLYQTLLQKNNTTSLNDRYDERNTEQQYTYLLKQNKKLKQRLRSLSIFQQKIMRNMDTTITTLVNKYRDSTLKECMLLVDRYRLEAKVNQGM